MPQYVIKDPSGLQITVEGDSPPTEAEADEIFARLKSKPKDTASLRPQEPKGVVGQLQDWFAGTASDRRIREQQRAEARRAGVGLNPTTGELAVAASLPLVGMAAGAAPLATAAGIATGIPGAVVGGELAERGGEAFAPGAGTLTRPVGEFVGGMATGGLGAGAPRGATATAHGLSRELPKAAESLGRSVAEQVRRLPKAQGLKGAALEMMAEGVLDTVLATVPGGNLAGGLFRRAARGAMRATLKKASSAGKAGTIQAAAAPAVPSGAMANVSEALAAAQKFGLRRGSKVHNIKIGGKVHEWYPNPDKAKGAIRTLAKEKGFKRVGVGKYQNPEGEVMELSWTFALK